MQRRHGNRAALPTTSFLFFRVHTMKPLHFRFTTSSCTFLYTLILSIVVLTTTSSLAANQDLLSCLDSNGVRNYTTFSTSVDQDYHHILNLVIQNPMFKRPTYNKPSVIVLPTTKEELASTILCCRRGSWDIRIRSGGHSYEGLSHRAETPFVLVDVMNLNRIDINLESETAWVESGARLGEIYYAISQASDSFGFSAGYCPTVGSGGHISGGGYGMMSRKYGLASDNVIDAILIDANGEIRDRESMGDDVFWAIRGGGGGNWGVIYAWKIKLVPVPKRVTVFRLLKHDMMIEEAANLLNKWQSIGPRLEDHFSLTILLRADYNGILVEFHGLYLGPKAEVMSRIEQVFPELDIADDEYHEVLWIESFLHIAGLDSIEQMNQRFLQWDDRAFKTKVDFPKELLPLEAISGALQRLWKQPRGFVVFNGYNGKMGMISSDASPFPHRNGTLMMIEYLVAWKMEEDSQSGEFLSWLWEFHEFMGKFIKSKPRLSYVNHVDLDLGVIDWRNASMASNAFQVAKKWGERYFSSNYERLVKAKTLIDPYNVFHHPQSIPPLPGIDLKQAWEIIEDR